MLMRMAKSKLCSATPVHKGNILPFLSSLLSPLPKTSERLHPAVPRLPILSGLQGGDDDLPRGWLWNGTDLIRTHVSSVLPLLTGWVPPFPQQIAKQCAVTTPWDKAGGTPHRLQGLCWCQMQSDTIGVISYIVLINGDPLSGLGKGLREQP